MHIPDTSQKTTDTTDTIDTTASRLLKSAATLFRQKGYSGTTTRELAALLGIQKATLYHHIEKKEDLLYALCIDSLRHIHAEVAQAMAKHTAPLDRLRALISTHVCIALADQDKFATVLIELRELSAARRSDVLHLQDDYETMVRQTIAAAQQSGALRREIPAKYQTLALLNLLNWSVFWFHPGGALNSEQLSELLTSIFLEGTLHSSTTTPSLSTH